VQYPPASVRAGEEGEAKVRVHFDRSGKILDVEVVTRDRFRQARQRGERSVSPDRQVPADSSGVNAEDAEFIIELPIISPCSKRQKPSKSAPDLSGADAPCALVR